MEKYTVKSLIVEIILVLFGVMMLFPVLLVFMNSVKSYQEINASLLAFPQSFHLENFVNAWDKMNYGRSFINSMTATACGVAGIVVVSAMAAYQIQRRECLASKVLFTLIICSMAIPFQVLMVPSVVVARNLRIVNTVHGIILMYWGFMLPMSMFLYHGFVKSVPRELDEAAAIDGCSPMRCFFAIIFPAIKPITATVVIINGLAIFNDFMLPLVMLSSDKTKTIPLAISLFFSSYMSEWNLIMAALTLTVVPVLIFFLIMQKKIMKGMVAGAVKG